MLEVCFECSCLGYQRTGKSYEPNGKKRLIRAWLKEYQDISVAPVAF